MGYREDFIILAATQYRLNPRDLTAQNFLRMAQLARESTVVRMRGDQSQVFLGTPVDETQDFRTWLRLPYPRLYIHPEGPLLFPNYDHGIEDDLQALLAQDSNLAREEAERLAAIARIRSPYVRGVILAEGTMRDLNILPPGARAQSRTRSISITSADDTAPWPTDVGVDLNENRHLVDRIILANFLMPIPGFELNAHTLVLAILTDGRLATGAIAAQQETRRRMRQWVVHTINFLTSPSIKLVRTEPDAALQKARSRSGKPPLDGWYEITYRQHVRDYTRAKIAPGTWHHAYRYDVRGHFRRYERGPLQGRVVWVTPHQRGVRHTLYRPKGYRVEPNPSAL